MAREALLVLTISGSWRRVVIDDWGQIRGDARVAERSVETWGASWSSRLASQKMAEGPEAAPFRVNTVASCRPFQSSVVIAVNRDLSPEVAERASGTLLGWPGHSRACLGTHGESDGEKKCQDRDTAGGKRRHRHRDWCSQV